MAAIKKFFALDDTQQQLRSFQRTLAQIPEADHDRFLMAQQLSFVIGIVLNNTDQFDNGCQQNISWLGNSLTNQLANLGDPKEPIRLGHFLSTFYRFVVELDLSMKNELSMELRSFQQFVKENTQKLDSREQDQVLYARQEMPIAILKAMLNHDEIGNLKNVSKFSAEIDQKFIGWETALANHETTVNAFQTSLDTQETAFNFVGLHEGFNDLAKTKRKELIWLRGFMTFFGCLLVLPILVELFFVYQNRDQIGAMQPIFLSMTAVFSLSLTVILVYFFRISVRSTDSCKAQLLQVELRKTLCRFIQNYATYSKDIKEKNPESLSKFESLIFSGIVSNEERLPSTFDGVDQFANFVKTMRAK
jgi:hypothetical protein